MTPGDFPFFLYDLPTSNMTTGLATKEISSPYPAVIQPVADTLITENEINPATDQFHPSPVLPGMESTYELSLWQFPGSGIVMMIFSILPDMVAPLPSIVGVIPS